MYSGRENPLVLHRKYTIDFHCQFRLKGYPFDTQRCPMRMGLKSPRRAEARLRMGALSYQGETELLEYRIKDISKREDFPCGEERGEGGGERRMISTQPISLV